MRDAEQLLSTSIPNKKKDAVTESARVKKRPRTSTTTFEVHPFRVTRPEPVPQSTSSVHRKRQLLHQHATSSQPAIPRPSTTKNYTHAPRSYLKRKERSTSDSESDSDVQALSSPKSKTTVKKTSAKKQKVIHLGVIDMCESDDEPPLQPPASRHPKGTKKHPLLIDSEIIDLCSDDEDIRPLIRPPATQTRASIACSVIQILSDSDDEPPSPLRTSSPKKSPERAKDAAVKPKKLPLFAPSPSKPSSESPLHIVSSAEPDKDSEIMPDDDRLNFSGLTWELEAEAHSPDVAAAPKSPSVTPAKKSLSARSPSVVATVGPESLPDILDSGGIHERACSSTLDGPQEVDKMVIFDECASNHASKSVSRICTPNMDQLDPFAAFNAYADDPSAAIVEEKDNFDYNEYLRSPSSIPTVVGKPTTNEPCVTRNSVIVDKPASSTEEPHDNQQETWEGVVSRPNQSSPLHKPANSAIKFDSAVKLRHLDTQTHNVGMVEMEEEIVCLKFARRDPEKACSSIVSQASAFFQVPLPPLSGLSCAISYSDNPRTVPLNSSLWFGRAKYLRAKALMKWPGKSFKKDTRLTDGAKTDIRSPAELRSINSKYFPVKRQEDEAGELDMDVDIAVAVEVPPESLEMSVDEEDSTLALLNSVELPGIDTHCNQETDSMSSPIVSQKSSKQCNYKEQPAYTYNEGVIIPMTVSEGQQHDDDHCIPVNTEGSPDLVQQCDEDDDSIPEEAVVESQRLMLFLEKFRASKPRGIPLSSLPLSSPGSKERVVFTEVSPSPLDPHVPPSVVVNLDNQEPDLPAQDIPTFNISVASPLSIPGIVDLGEYSQLPASKGLPLPPPLTRMGIPSNLKSGEHNEIKVADVQPCLINLASLGVEFMQTSSDEDDDLESLQGLDFEYPDEISI